MFVWAGRVVFQELLSAGKYQGPSRMSITQGIFSFGGGRCNCCSGWLVGIVVALVIAVVP